MPDLAGGSQRRAATSGSQRRCRRGGRGCGPAERRGAGEGVVEWCPGTYDVEADGWLRNVVSLYNSQRAPVDESPWQFTAVSPTRLQVQWLARRVAGADCTVLIRGTTGSGKDVLACIERPVLKSASSVSTRLGCSINCGPIPQ